MTKAHGVLLATAISITGVAARAKPPDTPAESGPENASHCKPCREGGCVQGLVTDLSGFALEDLQVRLQPGAGPNEPKTVRTDKGGGFFFTGIPDGTYRILIESPGYAHVRTEPAFAVKRGVTYLFEAPFELSTGPETPGALVREPLPCRKGGRQKSDAPSGTDWHRAPCWIRDSSRDSCENEEPWIDPVRWL